MPSFFEAAKTMHKRAPRPIRPERTLTIKRKQIDAQPPDAILSPPVGNSNKKAIAE